MGHVVRILFELLLLCVFAAGFAGAAVWESSAIYPSEDIQRLPDVDEGIVVWQQYVEFDGAWDWDIYGINLLDENAPVPIYVAAFEANQEEPSVSGSFVAWQDDYYSDWDVYVTDISDSQSPYSYLLTPYLDNQSNPRVHGNTVVWQHEIEDPDTHILDWDIYAADVTEPNQAIVYPVRSDIHDQQFPALWRTRSVWQDDARISGLPDIAGADLWLRNAPEFISISQTQRDQQQPSVYEDTVVWDEDFGGGDFEIFAADISDPQNPAVERITNDPAGQYNADIYKHLVVWQDNRHGNWDIYGYNLSTGQEFRITDDPSDQVNPAIWENLVVWADDRGTATNIYGVVLEGPEIAECSGPLPGDADGNCRVDLADLAKIAENWLVCLRDPVEACAE